MCIRVIDKAEKLLRIGEFDGTVSVPIIFGAVLIIFIDTAARELNSVKLSRGEN